MAIDSMKFKKILFLLALAVGMSITFFSFGKRIVLIAGEDVQVSVLPNGDKVIGTIRSGQQVEVLECEDLKHYIVPKVRLSDGREGYVIVGEFHLVRHSAWKLFAGPLSFSCL